MGFTGICIVDIFFRIQSKIKAIKNEVKYKMFALKINKSLIFYFFIFQLPNRRLMDLDTTLIPH